MTQCDWIVVPQMPGRIAAFGLHAIAECVSYRNGAGTSLLQLHHGSGIVALCQVAPQHVAKIRLKFWNTTVSPVPAH
jgi:hypothetical protein